MLGCEVSADRGDFIADKANPAQQVATCGKRCAKNRQRFGTELLLQGADDLGEQVDGGSLLTQVFAGERRVPQARQKCSLKFDAGEGQYVQVSKKDFGVLVGDDPEFFNGGFELVWINFWQVCTLWAVCLTDAIPQSCIVALDNELGISRYGMVYRLDKEIDNRALADDQMMQEGCLGEREQLLTNDSVTKEYSPVWFSPRSDSIPSHSNPHIDVTKEVCITTGKAAAKPKGVNVLAWA